MVTRSETKDEIGSSDSINITGHTTQITAITHLGSDPDQWLLALRGLEELENGTRKRKLLQHFFTQSGKILDSNALRKSRSYALLLGKEALFYGEIDVEDARRTFQMGLSMCQNTPVLYVMFAQFELDQGRKDKALKVLQHGQLCVENTAEILAAKKMLAQGCARIDGLKEIRRLSPLRNITNDSKQENLISGATKNLPVITTKELSKLPSTPTEQIHTYPKQKAEGKSRFSFPPNVGKPSISTLNPTNLPPVPENSVCDVQTSVDTSSNLNFQTPTPRRVTELSKSLDLGLGLDSPASPNLTFDITNLSITKGNSKTISNAARPVTSSTTSALVRRDTVAQSHSALPSLAHSERKSSPVSRLMQLTCQTTAKKAIRVPSCTAPRRVLMKGKKSQWSDSDSDEDIRPLEKSPDDVNGSVLPQKEGSRVPDSYSASSKVVTPRLASSNNGINHAQIDVMATEKVLPGPSLNTQLSHASAFRRYPKHGLLNCTSGPSEPSDKDPFVSKPNHGRQQEERQSGQSNKVLFGRDKENIPSTAVIARSNLSAARRSSGVRSRNSSDSSSSCTNLGAQNIAPRKSRTTLEHQYHQSYARDEATTSIHPAYCLMMEKKIIEINGTAYILLKLLGKGGSSKVYQVLNPKTSAIVAVKKVNLVGCESSVLEGYKNEINFLKKLQGNRYIIKLIDYEIREEHLYLIMECGSLDLSAFLKKQKCSEEPLEMIDILAFWKNMLRAVEAIHKHGVIHLDLKPANFMLVDYTLKLIDFGIANSIQVDQTSIIKDTQLGTLNYMAPETINDQSGGIQNGAACAPKFKVGPKADVWSLGCILYYIMYGKTPFQHIHHQTMKLNAITDENHQIGFPDFPRKELVEIVQACLTRDPKKRPSVEMLLNHPLLN